MGLESTKNKPTSLPPLYTPDPFAPAPSHAPADQGDRRKRRREENVEGSRECWFCLQNPNCDAHLVVSVGAVRPECPGCCGVPCAALSDATQEMYLALAKGGVVDEHLLIVPIYHYSSMVALPGKIANVRLMMTNVG